MPILKIIGDGERMETTITREHYDALKMLFFGYKSPCILLKMKKDGE